MKLILAIIFSLCSLNPWGQWDFASIDEKSKTVPDSLVDYKEIAVFLTKNLESEEEEVLRMNTPAKELHERILFEKEFIDRLLRIKKPLRIFVFPKPYKD